jgi:general stress protein 26
MSDPKEIIKTARDLIEKVKVAMFSTVDGDRPCTRPMGAFQISDNEIWMATFNESRKVRQVKANPNVELCFMDSNLNHVRLAGKARVVEDADAKTRLWETVPEMGDYFKSAEDPAYVIIQTTVHTIEYLEHGMGKKPEVVEL